jgi:hypothetical protein
MAPICGTSLELHQYSNPDPTSDLTLHRNTTPFTNPQNLGSLCKASFAFIVGAARPKTNQKYQFSDNAKRVKQKQK